MCTGLVNQSRWSAPRVRSVSEAQFRALIPLSSPPQIFLELNLCALHCMCSQKIFSGSPTRFPIVGLELSLAIVIVVNK